MVLGFVEPDELSSNEAVQELIIFENGSRGVLTVNKKRLGRFQEPWTV